MKGMDNTRRPASVYLDFGRSVQEGLKSTRPGWLLPATPGWSLRTPRAPPRVPRTPTPRAGLRERRQGDGMGLSRTPGSRSAGRWIVTMAAVAALAVAAGLVVAIVGSVTSAPAASVTPVERPGNPSCPAGTIELKVEPVADGTFTDGTLTVTIDVRD